MAALGSIGGQLARVPDARGTHQNIVQPMMAQRGNQPGFVVNGTAAPGVGIENNKQHC